MIYQIVSPIQATIQGDSFKEAVKNYVKLNHDMNIKNLIIKDQINNAWQAKLRYYMENQRNKVGIDMYPYTNPILAQPMPILPVVGSANSPHFATSNNVFIKI
jgi:hypothetical protein